MHVGGTWLARGIENGIEHCAYHCMNFPGPTTPPSYEHMHLYSHLAFSRRSIKRDSPSSSTSYASSSSRAYTSASAIMVIAGMVTQIVSPP
jgi:hypothetical protein